MSGTAAGTGFHVAPEAAIRGPHLAIVRTGDRVTIDATTHKLCVEIDSIGRDEGEIGSVEAGWGWERCVWEGEGRGIGCRSNGPQFRAMDEISMNSTTYIVCMWCSKL